jgi:hypothetical protein
MLEPLDTLITLALQPAEEVKRYAQAYAEMAWDTLPLELRTLIMDRHEKPIVIAMAMVWAAGGVVAIPGKVAASTGTWAACGMHHKLWQEYKQRFPAASSSEKR